MVNHALVFPPKGGVLRAQDLVCCNNTGVLFLS